MVEVCKLQLPLHVDTLHFCPMSENSNVLACGLYEHDAATNQRRGGVGLLKIEPKFGENGQMPADLICQKILDSCGVFELQWLPNEFGFVCAMADGSLKFYAYDKHLNFADFQLKIDENRMLLNLDICQQSTDSNSIVASDNKGCLHLASMTSSRGTVELVKSWTAHTGDFGTIPEIWCCTFQPGRANCAISGSEQGDWKMWDLRIAVHSTTMTSQFSAVTSKRHAHSSGVTCVACHPLDENLLFTGGYDDCAKIWDLRNVKNALNELNLGGGVWRIKFSAENPQKILCSCMYNGWALLNYSGGGGLQLLTGKADDGALLYGVDWLNSNCFAACTFYDNFVRVFMLE